jgi:hypothetical protein
MKKSAIRLLFTIISFFTLTNFNLTFAQTKTITGYVHNKAGQPLEVNMTLNTPKQDNTKSNPDGSYTLITEDFPTGIRDEAKQDNTKIWPNPARTKAHMQLPALEGTLEAYDLNGKLLGKINLSNTDELTFNATNFALIRYVNKNDQSTQKLLIEQGNNTISVQAQSNQEPKTKSGLTETFGYKITFTGENIQDTTIAVENFDKNQTTHNQNHTLDELITKIKNLPDSATTSNSVTINLKEYFNNDDETTYTSNDERITFNGDYATIDLSKGNVNATINAQEPGRNVQSTINITKYVNLNVKAENEQTNEALENAMIIIDNLEGKLDTTYTNNGEANIAIKPGTIHVMKITKNGYTGWVQEIKTEKDTTITKELIADEEYETRTGAKVQIIQIFNNAWRNVDKVTRKPNYNNKWTHNFKTTDDDNTTKLPQKYFDKLYENIQRIETQIENMPTLSTEQKNTLRNFITRMDTIYIETIPSDVKTTQNALYSLYTMNLPGTGGIGFSNNQDSEIINSIIRIRKSIAQYDDEYQMQRTTGQEYLSFIFGATDPSVYTTSNNSILDEKTLLTEPSPLDHKLFKHAMNTPPGTSYKEGVEIAHISNEAAKSTLVPANYNR